MKRPLYILLRQYRALQILLTLFLCYITYIIVEWLIESPFKDLSDWHVAPIATTLPALIAGLFAIVNSVMKRNEIDEHDKEDK